MAKSRNIRIIRNVSELENEINYEEFEYKKYFVHICDLIPNDEKERLEILPVDKSLIEQEGVVYVFVIKGKIFKIGQSMDSMKDRIQSYNCGKVEYRTRGTCSTTNYFILQSLLKINEQVEVYAFFPDKPTYTLFGVRYCDSWPVSKRAENIIITKFVGKHNKKPIGCTQE